MKISRVDSLMIVVNSVPSLMVLFSCKLGVAGNNKGVVNLTALQNREERGVDSRGGEFKQPFKVVTEHVDQHHHLISHGGARDEAIVGVHRAGKTKLMQKWKWVVRNIINYPGLYI